MDHGAGGVEVGGTLPDKGGGGIGGWRGDLRNGSSKRPRKGARCQDGPSPALEGKQLSPNWRF